jgi:hypothetical protein
VQLSEEGDDNVIIVVFFFLFFFGCNLMKKAMTIVVTFFLFLWVQLNEEGNVSSPSSFFSLGATQQRR